VAAVLLVLSTAVRRVTDVLHTAVDPVAGDTDGPTLERRSCEEAASIFNSHVSAPFQSVHSSGVWARTLDDYANHSIKAEDLESMEYTTTRCQSVDEAIVSNSVPPWCPGSGDPELEELHFNTTMLRRYSFSIINRGICWRTLSPGRRADPATLNSLYRSGVFRGGVLSLPHRRLADRALCYYPRDSGSCMRTQCGCGKTTHVKYENRSTYTPGESCNGDQSFWRNATDVSVSEYVRLYWKGNRTHEDIIPSMSAEVYARVGRRRLVWDNPYEVVTAMRGWHPGYNEVVVRPWFGVEFADVPIDALFYFGDDDETYQTANVGFMRAVQRSFLRHSGRSLPLFKVDVTECHPAPFSCA